MKTKPKELLSKRPGAAGKEKVCPRLRLKTKTLDNVQFFLLAMPAILLIFVFCYIPMGGIVVTFKKYNVRDGIFGSPWIGFKNFNFLFTTTDIWRAARNTVLMNLLFKVVGLVCNVAFALLCFKIRSNRAIKVYQTTTIVPSFLSYVVVGYLVYAILKPSGGVLNQIIELCGGEPIQWYSKASYWPAILTITMLWHGVGNGSLFYFATLRGIDPTYFEAAALDGATPWQEFRYIILPHLKTVIIIMQIMGIGSLLGSDFSLFYNIPRNMGRLYETTDVLSTFTYRALMEVGNIGMTSAIGFIQSVVGFFLVIGTNAIVRKIDPDSSLF